MQSPGLPKAYRPRTATRPPAGLRIVGDMSILHKPFVWWRHWNPGFRRPPGELSHAAKRCLTPHGDEKCLAITGLSAAPSLISLRIQAPPRSWMITPRRESQTLSAIHLRKDSGRGWLPFYRNPKRSAMKPERASLRTPRMSARNTSGAMKGRSMTEEVLIAAHGNPATFEGAQTGKIPV
jgi:hypothetical protein